VLCTAAEEADFKKGRFWHSLPKRLIRDSGAMRYIRLARVYSSLSARAAAPLGTPIFFGLFLVAFIVFGPTGMRAADLVFTMRSSPLLAIGLWLGWTILLFPVARLALIPPSSLYLRWLPAPRAILYATAAGCVFVVELPWMILFARGEGIASAFAAGFRRGGVARSVGHASVWNRSRAHLAWLGDIGVFAVSWARVTRGGFDVGIRGQTSHRSRGRSARHGARGEACTGSSDIVGADARDVRDSQRTGSFGAYADLIEFGGDYLAACGARS
jgi:hypothetical protein